MLQAAIQDHSHVTSYRHKEVDTGRTAHVAQQIKDGTYEQIWVTTPSTRVIREIRWHAYMTRLTQWLKLATTAATLFFIVGPLNGQWKEPLLQNLMSDVGGKLYYYSLGYPIFKIGQLNLNRSVRDRNAKKSLLTLLDIF